MPKRQVTLTGRVVAITGGARGIGRATARSFARAGARVAIGDLDLELSEAVATELGGGGVAFPLDVTDRASFERFVDDAERSLGPLDVLVNNAGIMPVGPFLQEDDATARRLVELNCHGVLHGMKIALPRFVERGQGHLVNIASIAGKAGIAGVATYCGTKHFVVGVTEAASLELQGTGVEISCVMPAAVNTELTAGIPNTSPVKNIEPDEVAAAIVDSVVTGRFDVYVPRGIGALDKLSYLLPHRARVRLAHLLKADTAALATDWTARKSYEDRAARSAPVAPA